MKYFGLFVLALTTPALGAEREFCAERPGLNTPPCTVDPGHVMAELGVVDWTRVSDSSSRTDTIVTGDALMRIGLDASTEVQLGWTAYGHVRTRDMTGVEQSGGTGDVTLSLLKGIAGDNGPVALQLFVTLPTGGQAIGAGDWGAGLRVPAAFDLTDKLQFDITPEVDAAVNTSGDGRHIAYGSAVGFTDKLSKTLQLAVEASAMRDEDPSSHSTNLLASTSLAWQAEASTQLDIGVVAGLNRSSPDVELYAGLSFRL